MRRPSRPARALGALLALTASTVACSSATPPEVAANASTVDSTAAPTTTAAGPVADQTPPLSTFGLAFHDDQLWVADFYGGQVLAVDPDSGSIIRRLNGADGVAPEVNDVAVSTDGTLFWIGFNDGAVAVLSNNEYKTFANVTPGTYSLALSPDKTKLYAGGAVGHAAPVATVDLTKQVKSTPSPLPVAMRSFDIGNDGKLYGARFGSAGARPGLTGALLEVDPTSGEAHELVSDLDGPLAVKLSPDNSVAYVLSLPPGGKPAVNTIDLASGMRRRPPIELRTPLADNLAVADDGRIFVSSYNDSLVNVIGPDGTVKTLHIGKPPPTPPKP
jgi:sugar lactone lactonase YvrE